MGLVRFARYSASRFSAVPLAPAKSQSGKQSQLSKRNLLMHPKVLSFIILLFSSTVAHAITIQDAVFDGTLSTHSSNHAGGIDSTSIELNGPGTFSLGGTAVSSTALPFPKLTSASSAAGALGQQVGSSGSTSLVYYFAITGGAGYHEVPVWVEASGGFTASGTGNGSYFGAAYNFSLGYAGVGSAGIVLTRSDSVSYPISAMATTVTSNFNLADTVFLTTNTLYQVVLSQYTSASSIVYGGSASASAFVDPIFTLQGPAADLLRIELSPGIGNQPATHVADTTSTLALLSMVLTGLVAAKAGSRSFE